MVKPTTNVGLISKILGNPLTTLPQGMVFLLLEAEDTIIGLALISGWDAHLGLTEVHILDPFVDDRESQLSVAKYFNEYLESLPFGKIVSFVPTTRQASVAFLQRAGFKREGTLKNSSIQDGVVVDQTILGADYGRVAGTRT